MEAARALSARIDASPALRSIFSEGKMLGVLLTAPPLRLPGAVGSPVTPIATV